MKNEIFRVEDPDEPILPSGKYEAGRMTLADESRYTALRIGRGQMPIAIANCITKDQAANMPLVVLANEERFTAAYYSEPLTQYATGWTDDVNVQAILDFIAPRVPVGRRFEWKKAVNSEAFLSETDDERAIGSSFKRVEYKGTSATDKTNNRGLTYRLDLDEEGAGILTEELIVARMLQRLRRNQLRRAYTALLASVTTTTAKTWSSGTTTPNEDIRTAALAALADSGLWPNRLLFDVTAWSNRKKGLSALLTAGSISGYLQSVQDIADDVQIDQALVARAVYQSAASTKSLITANKVVLFTGQDAPSRDDPTNVKRFVTPVGDGDFRVYRQPVGSKFVDITVEYYDQVVATATVGAQALTIS